MWNRVGIDGTMRGDQLPAKRQHFFVSIFRNLIFAALPPYLTDGKILHWWKIFSSVILTTYRLCYRKFFVFNSKPFYYILEEVTPIDKNSPHLFGSEECLFMKTLLNFYWNEIKWKNNKIYFKMFVSAFRGIFNVDFIKRKSMLDKIWGSASKIFLNIS